MGAVSQAKESMRKAFDKLRLKKTPESGTNPAAQIGIVEAYFKAKDNEKKAEDKKHGHEKKGGSMEGGGGASSAGSALSSILTITLIAFPIALMTGMLDDLGGRGARTAIESKVDLQPIRNIPGQISDMFTGLTQNPFEETTTAQAETSTQTAAGTGIKVLEDNVARTGIISPNPRSRQEYSLMVGMRNPTRDFIGDNSQLSLGNEGNITNRTDLSFGAFVWDNGISTLEPRGMRDYISASASSLPTTARYVNSTAAVGPTNIVWEVDYSYDFKSAYKIDIGGAMQNAISMYHAKFLVGSPKMSSRIDTLKESYKVNEEAAGGPVTITRTVIEPFLEPGKKLNLIFTIKNADANAGVLEAIDFKDRSKILLLVPNDFIPSSNNLVCVPLGPYQRCTLNNILLVSNTGDLKAESCGVDGCDFNEYQGFATSNNRVLKDGNELDFASTFSISPAIDKDKVYNVYVVFLQGAYTYHAAMRKGMGVQPE